MSSTLKADDGTELEIKEGIVLDENGAPLSRQPFNQNKTNSTHSGNVRIIRWQSGWLAALLVVPLVVSLFLTGFAVLSVVAIAVLIFWLLRALISLIGPIRK